MGKHVVRFNVKRILVIVSAVLFAAVLGLAAYLFFGFPYMARNLSQSLQGTARSAAELVSARVYLPVSGNARFRKRVFASEEDQGFQAFWNQVVDFARSFAGDYFFNWEGDFVLSYGYKAESISRFRLSLSSEDPIEMIKGVDVRLTLPPAEILDIKLSKIDSLLGESKLLSFHEHDEIQQFFRNNVSDIVLLAVQRPEQRIFEGEYESVVDFTVELESINFPGTLNNEILVGVEHLFRPMIQLWPGVKMNSLVVSFQ